MEKTAKPLYTDPDDIKAYEERKRTRRALLTTIGALLGGWGGGVVGAGMSAVTGKRVLPGTLMGAGIGAGIAGIGARALTNLHTRYMESAGLDPTIPSLRAKLQKDAEWAVVANPTDSTMGQETRRAEMNKTAAIRSQARRAALVKRAGVLDRLAAIGARYKELLAGNSPLMGNYKWGKRYVDALTSGEAGVSPAAEKLKYMLMVLTSNSPAGSELRKVYATRAGTGVAGIAGLKALLGGSGEKKAAEAASPEEQAFAIGFCKAAEAAGVDPAELAKVADDNSFGNVAGEFLGHTGGNVALLSLLGGLVGRGPGAAAGAAAGALGVPLGALAALITPRRSAADQKAWDSNSHFMRNMLVPGSGSYNMWKRIGRIIGGASETKAAAAAEPKASAKSPSSDVVHGIGNSRLERMGVVTAPAVATLLGSLLGGRGVGRRLAGGAVGLGTGLLGNLGGSGLAYVTPTRSGEAQLKHDSALHILKNLLLPGVGTYNKAKRLEREQVHKWYN